MSRLLVLLLPLLLAACAGLPTRGEVAEKVAVAEQQFRDGQFALAAAGFSAVVLEAPRSQRDGLLLRAAEAWREEGQPERASRVFEQIDSGRLKGEQRLRALLLGAELAIDREDLARAQTLVDLAEPLLTSAYRAWFLELRGRAWRRSDPMASATAFAQLGELLVARDKAENARRVRDLLNGLSDRRLRDAAALTRVDESLRPFLARAFTARGFSLPAVLRRAPTPVHGSAATAVRGERLALLLPLSGPLKNAAKSVRDGFLAAHFTTSDAALSVDVIDSGDRADSTIEAYRRAVSSGATAVVGPLNREYVSALFEEIDLPVPVLALNRSTGTLPPGQRSFALLPEDEGAAMAARMQQRELTRVLAVVSDDDAALRALEGFSSRHADGGGSLVGTVTLRAGTIDYQSEIRSVLVAAGLPTGAPESLDEPHDPGFDAVFLALRADQARLAVPQLRLFGLTELPMLGTSLLNEAGDANRLDRDLEGVEFCDSPWLFGAVPGTPERSATANALERSRGPAARLFAFGMDAYRLARQPPSADTEAVLSGATGLLSVDPLGDVQREPGLAEFRNGRPRAVNTAAMIDDAEPPH